MRDFGIQKIKYFDGHDWVVEKVGDVMKNAITSSGDKLRKKIISSKYD